MAKRTYNRQPLSVGMDYYEKQGLSDKYFNLNEFHGLNTNKNYVTIDQQSFADCDNVYVNQDGQLSTRPPIKFYRPSIQNGKVFIVPGYEEVLQIFYKGGITFYHTQFSGIYRLRWSFKERVYSMQTTSDIFLDWIQSWFILLENNNGEILLKTLLYDYDADTFLVNSTNVTNSTGTTNNIVTINDMLYVPNNNEDKNILTDSYIQLSVISNIDEFPNTLIGKQINIKIGDRSYTVLANEYTKYVIVDSISTPNITIQNKRDCIQVSKSTEGKLYYLIISDSVPYVSFDGNIFLRIRNSVQSSEESYKHYCISELNDDKSIALWYIEKVLKNDYVSVYRCLIGPNSIPNTVDDWTSMIIKVPVQSKVEYLSGIMSLDGSRFIRSMYSYNEGDDSAVTYNNLTKIHCFNSPDSDTLVFIADANYNIQYSWNEWTDNTITNTFRTGTANVVNFIHYDSSNSNSYHLSSALVLDDFFNSKDSNLTLSASKIVNESVTYLLQVIIKKPDELYTTYLALNKSYDFYNCMHKETTDLYAGYFYKEYCFYDSYNAYKNEDGIEYPKKAYFSFKNGLIENEEENLAYSCKVYNRLNSVCSILASVDIIDESGKVNVKDLKLEQQGIIKITDYIRNNPDLYNDIVPTKYLDTDRDIMVNTMYKRTCFPVIYVRNDILPEGEGKHSLDVLRNVPSASISYRNYFTFNDSGDILSKYYIYNGSCIELLNTDNFPLLITDDLTIRYYNFSSKTIFSNDIVNKAYISYTVDAESHLFVPEFYIEGFVRAFSKDNKLYILSDADKKGKLYIKSNNVLSFESKITALVNLSTTSIAIFCESSVYILFEDNGTHLVKSKLQLGNKYGNDVINIYDGSAIILPTLNGLTCLAYEQFVQSSDQVYTYLSESISDEFDKYYVNTIKLYQYKHWIFVYSKDVNYFYLYDISKKSWWKWSLLYPVQNIIYDNSTDTLMLIIRENLYKLDFSSDEFSDFAEVKINWKLCTQKLHFNAPNNYKHIRGINVITGQGADTIRYKLLYKNYRNLNNTQEDDMKEFTIEGLTTIINRIHFIKTNAFQLQLSNDEDSTYSNPFITSGICIKYRITEKIR